MADEAVWRVAPGVFSVKAGERHEIVYVAGSPPNQWACWNGLVFRSSGEARGRATRTTAALGPLAQSLSAPMPATVIAVLVGPGARVAKGDTIVLLEAMKMELPIRALGDATVKTIHCQVGDLVKADQPLVELE
jgi:biotin carboxyl carrier protein